MVAAGKTPNGTTYNILIDVLGKNHRPEEATAMYETMLEHHVTPCVFTFTSLIDMWGKLSRPDKVMEVYNEMVHRGIKPNQNVHVVCFID
jgi:pentatricopeptide repeat protein